MNIYCANCSTVSKFGNCKQSVFVCNACYVNGIPFSKGNSIEKETPILIWTNGYGYAIRGVRCDMNHKFGFIGEHAVRCGICATYDETPIFDTWIHRLRKELEREFNQTGGDFDEKKWNQNFPVLISSLREKRKHSITEMISELFPKVLCIVIYDYS